MRLKQTSVRRRWTQETSSRRVSTLLFVNETERADFLAQDTRGVATKVP